MTKRGIFGIVLLSISLSTLAVFLISNFIQPILPSSVNSTLVLFVASFVGVLGILAALNDIVELFQKILGSQRDVQQSSAEIGEHSLTIYPHRNPPYNAAKLLYTDPEVAKDLIVKIVYQDSAGDPQTKVVTDFFPKEDPGMWKHHYKYDFLEPNQVVYFHLLKKKSTSDGKATVIATFTGATSGKSVRVEREFDLEEF